MTIAIQATLTRCRHGKPLVVLNSDPFNSMEIRPHDLHCLAQQLITLADMANKLPMGGKNFQPTKVEIGKTGIALDQDSREQTELCNALWTAGKGSNHE